MGLLDSLVGAADSMMKGGVASSPIGKSVLDLLGQGGGLSALVQTMQQKGLGDVVGSWVGTGQNQPISAQQVESALGGQVKQLASQHGLSPDAVSQAMAQLLPGLVDQLTPNGQLPTGGALEQGLSSLRSKLGL